MANNSVTVWTMPVDTPSTSALARWHAVLDAREQAQAARFRADHDRNSYIAAHALTRALLAEIGGRSAGDWSIIETQTGKPVVADGSVQFNLSHTAGFVVCTASAGLRLGIDVEARDRRQKHADLAHTVLAPSEHAILTSLPEDPQPECFLRFWTLREAYVKATGQGISFPREDFAFTLDPPSIRFSNGKPGSDWQFFSWDEQRHILSLAVQCPHSTPIELTKRQLSENDLF